MERRYSSEVPDTMVNVNSEVEVAFQCDRGTEVIHIDEPLLTTVDVAKQRAEATFLEQSYVEASLSYSTYHIDNLHVGSIVSLNTILYKVTSVIDIVDGAKCEMKVIAKRWL